MNNHDVRPDPRLHIGVREAMKLLDITSRQSIDNWVREGKLHKLKLGGRVVFARAEVRDLVVQSEEKRIERSFSIQAPESMNFGPTMGLMEQDHAKLKARLGAVESQLNLMLSLPIYGIGERPLEKYRGHEGIQRLYVEARIDVERTDRVDWSELEFRHWISLIAQMDLASLDLLFEAIDNPDYWRPFNTLIERITGWLTVDANRYGGGGLKPLLAMAQSIQDAWWGTLAIHLVRRGDAKTESATILAKIRAGAKPGPSGEDTNA